MAVKIGSARSDERGKITGGKAGDQKNGLEVSTQSWYKHSKGWVLLRCKDPGKAEIIAKTMEEVCASDRVGYDQTGRNDLYKALKDKGFDVDRLTRDVETDCSALVVFCCAAAGITDISTSTITSNLAANLVKTGWFEKISDAKYTEKDDYLLRGDVLVTRSKGHTVVVLTDGEKAEKADSDDALEPENGVTIAEGTWNVRKGPGTEYESVGRVKGGTRLEGADTDGWIPVVFGDELCWIGKKAVKL